MAIGTLTKVAGLTVIALSVGSGTLLMRDGGRPPSFKVPPVSAETRSCVESLASGSLAYSKHNFADAKRHLESTIARYGSSKDARTQDVVTKAKLTLGFISAGEKDWNAARATFLATAASYRGSGAIDPGFGRLDDQAAYQAAVCLQASGSNQEAIGAYVQFLHDRKSSPLVAAVRNRLVDLDPANVSKYDRALDMAVLEQQRLTRLAIAACGPMVLAEFLRLSGEPARSDNELLKLCGTTEDGTTMAGLAAGFASLGHRMEGFRLNRKDFADARVPFVWLSGNHYLLVEAVTDTSVLTFDPVVKAVTETKLPPVDDTKFIADVLLPKN